MGRGPEAFYALSPVATRRTTTKKSSPAPRRQPTKAKAAVKEPARPGFAIEAARSLSDDKCEDVILLDVRGLNPIADYVLIASGTSDRQMRSALHHVEELGGKLGSPALRRTADERSTWLVADFFDLVVHVFEPETRVHYDLETLWGDAPKVAWERSSARGRAKTAKPRPAPVSRDPKAPRNLAGLTKGDGIFRETPQS